jgi:hypothetical protein
LNSIIKARFSSMFKHKKWLNHIVFLMMMHFSALMSLYGLIWWCKKKLKCVEKEIVIWAASEHCSWIGCALHLRWCMLSDQGLGRCRAFVCWNPGVFRLTCFSGFTISKLEKATNPIKSTHNHKHSALQHML